MVQVRHSWIIRYSVAVCASLAALILTQLLWYHIQPALYPFFLAAVMLSSWFGGLGPGLVSTLLGTGFSEHFFLADDESISWDNLGRISYFISVAILICTLNARLRYTQRRAEASAIEAQQNRDLLLQTLAIRKKAEEERNQLLGREQLARQEAESANRAKDEFLAMLSHELRTPLTAITGWVGMLRSGRLDEARIALALETIERNATLQLQLVEDLLDISRIIRGDLWLDNQPVNLIDVIQEAVELLQPKMEEKQIQFTFEIDPSLKDGLNARDKQSNLTSIFVLGDSERLQQVVLNLLSNAIKFTPEEGAIAIHLSITDLMQEQRSDVQLQIRDTGIGINAEFLPYVFDRFRQADSSNTRTYKGLGLGLAIAHYLVERQGGTIRAGSLGEGQGATFTVKFPLLTLDDRSKSSAGSPLTISPEFTLNELSVLVIDDEVDTRIWLKTVFELYQAQVIAVASVDEAMMQFDRLWPDVVVSDIAMPGKDGYTLMEELKHREHLLGRSIPAIALTAHASPEDIEKALAAGFWQHLAKPIKAEDLMAVIASRGFER